MALGHGENVNSVKPGGMAPLSLECGGMTPLSFSLCADKSAL
jgi:hypothetical protein